MSGQSGLLLNCREHPQKPDGSLSHIQSIRWARADSLCYHPWATYGETELSILQSFPQWLDPECWQGFEDMRRSMGKSKPFTKRAAILVLKELQRIKDAGHCPNAALDQSTLRGWADVWPAKEKLIEPCARSQADATAEYLRQEAEHRKSIRRIA